MALSIVERDPCERPNERRDFTETSAEYCRICEREDVDAEGERGGEIEGEEEAKEGKDCEREGGEVNERQRK